MTFCCCYNYYSVCLHLKAKRISGSDALSHPYLDEGRLRYHTCMCKCCYSVPSGRVYTRDFEPPADRPFSHNYEQSMHSVWQGKGDTFFLSLWPFCYNIKLHLLLTWRTYFDDPFSLFISELIHRFITEHQQGKRVPLCINPQSAAFKTFIRSVQGYAFSDKPFSNTFTQKWTMTLRCNIYSFI